MPHNRLVIDDRTAMQIAKDYARTVARIGRDIFGLGCLLVAAIGAYGWWNG